MLKMNNFNFNDILKPSIFDIDDISELEETNLQHIYLLKMLITFIQILTMTPNWEIFLTKQMISI